MPNVSLHVPGLAVLKRNQPLVSTRFGFAVALRVALALATEVAAIVVTEGAASVVNESTAPKRVPIDDDAIAQ